MGNSRFKFRAWDKSEKTMLTWEILQGCKHLALSKDMDKNNFIVIPVYWNHEIMQYTSLKDINGVEIYERDIVKLENNFIAEVIITPLNGIEFKSHNQNYRDEFASEYDNYIGNFPCEVVGNIHENKELLEG